jgi:hypothetical protein
MLQVGPAAFKLHLKPAQTGDRSINTRNGISAVGQGLGLQILPGSTPEVDCVSIHCSSLALSQEHH